MNIYQFFDDIGSAHPFYKMCIDRVRLAIPCNHKYTMIDGVKMDRPEVYTRSLRLNLLKDDPEGVWLDVDCIIGKWFDFEFEPEKPYVLRSGCSAAGMYSNGCTDTIKELLEEQQKKGACPCGAIRKMKDKFNFFPEGYIQHLQFGHVLKRKIFNGTWKNKYCTIKKGAGGLPILIFNQTAGG